MAARGWGGGGDGGSHGGEKSDELQLVIGVTDLDVRSFTPGTVSMSSSPSPPSFSIEEAIKMAGFAVSRSIAVRNIPADVGDDELKELFTNAGPVVRGRIVCEGIGFIEFVEEASVSQAVNKKNVWEVKDCRLRVDGPR